MADNLTTATIDVRANTRGMERDILKALRTVEFSEINTKKSSQSLGRITGQVSEFNKSLEASNARVIAFGASAGAIFAVEKAFSSLISSTIDVEKRLTDINVLLGLSTSGLEKFGNSLFGIAKNTAQSFSEVANAATEFSRQGLGVEETLKRTNAALILTRLSGLDAKSSVDALTATLNSFAGSALDAVEVVNKLANVDAAFAVSSADLANAISRVGSTAVDAGVSLDELIALVTSAQQTTARGGAVIGNSFKTIFTRLQRGKVQELLGSLGVDTSEGQSAISLLQQLATTYDTLGAAQKSYIAEQVGGVFQINILKAALSDLGKEYSIFGRALDTSLSSTDQAIKRNELLNQTVSALSSQAVSGLQQAADKIGSIVFEPNAKGFLSGFNNLLDSFNNIDAESAGGKLMTGFFKGIGDFISGPGAVLATAVIVKLFANLTKFAAGSAKELLGTNKAAQQQAAIEQSILSILQKNSQFTSQILSGKITTVQAEKQMLDYLTAQSNILREQERLSKVIGANLSKVGISIGASGVPMVAAAKGKKAASSGFIPNFASDQAIGQAMENSGARQHGYKAGKAKKTTIHDGNGKSFKSFVNSKEDVKTFTNSAGKKATVVRPPNGFGENTQYAAGGFVPNFAKNEDSIKRGVVFEKRLNKALSGSASFSPNAPMDFPLPTGYGNNYEARRKIGISDASIYGDAKLTRSRKSEQSLLDKYLRTPEGSRDFLSAKETSRGFINLNPNGLSMLFSGSGTDSRGTSYISSINTQLSTGAKNLISSRFGKNHKKSRTLAMPYIADKINEKNLSALSSGFIPNFAKMQDLYKNAKMKEGRDDPFGKRAAKANLAAKKGIPIKDLGSLPYTMIHAGSGGNFQASANYTKKDKKTNSSTQYVGKIWTAGLDPSKLNRKTVQDRVGDALVTEANNLTKIFNPSGDGQFSNYSQLSNTGSVFSAAGTVFESAVRKAFNVSAQGQGDRIDFPSPSSELKSFFGNAPGPYEAKITNDEANRSSTLSKWVAINGLSKGFIPNFAKSKLSFSQTKEDEFGISSLNAIMGGKKVGRFETSTRKDGIIDIGDMTVDKANRGKGIGTQLYKEAIKRNAGKKMKGQLLPQMNRLLEKIKKGEPVSAETLYPQIKRADLAKSSVFEVYGHKGLEAEKMTRDQFTSFVNAKIIELKKDPKRLQGYFGNVEADEYGGLGVDLQTQHSSGFVPNFLDVTKGGLPFGVRGRMNYGLSSSKPNIQLGTGAEESTLAHELFHGAYSKSTNKKAVSNPLIGKFISSPGKYAGGSGVISDTLFKGVNRKNLYSSLGLNPVQIDFDGKNAGSTYSGGKAIDEIVTRIQEKVFKNKGNLDSLSVDEKNFVKNLEQQGLISNKRLSNISRRSQEGSKFRSLVESKFSSVMGNQAYSGFVPNFASGIITGDVIRGNEYKSVLDFLAKTNKPVRTIIGPSGSGKTTMASKSGGSIVKSFNDLAAFDSYILDRATMSMSKDEIVSENLKKIFRKSGESGTLDLLVGSRNTIKSLREKRAKEGDSLIPDRKQFTSGSGGISSFVKGARGFASEYPGASVSRIFKDKSEYKTKKILSGGFVPNFASPKLIEAINKRIKNPNVSQKLKEGIGLNDSAYMKAASKLGIDVAGLEAFLPQMGFPLRGKDKVLNLSKAIGFGFGRSFAIDALKMGDWNYVKPQFESAGFAKDDFDKLSKYVKTPKGESALKWWRSPVSKASGFVPNFASPKKSGKTFNNYMSKASADSIRFVHPLSPQVDAKGNISFPGLPKRGANATVIHREAMFGQDKLSLDEFYAIAEKRKKDPRFWGRNSFEYIYNSGGFVPNFADALNNAIAREKAAGLSSSQIYVDKHSSLKNKNNPMGLMVANTRDEPFGGIQGIKRAKKEGRNPKTYGAATGFVPNFAKQQDLDEIKSFSDALAKLTSEIANREAEISAAEARLKADQNNLATNTFSQENADAIQALNVENNKNEQAKKNNPALAGGLDKIIEENNKKIIAIKEKQEAESLREIESSKKLVESNKSLADKLIRERDEVEKNMAAKKKSMTFMGKAGNLAGKAGGFISRNSMGLGFGLQAAAGMAGQYAGNDDTVSGRTTKAVAGGIGDIASFTGTGAMIAGPYGAAAGFAVGLGKAAIDVTKALNTKVPDLEKALQSSSDGMNRFGESGQKLLQLNEQYGDALNSGNPGQAADIMVKTQQAYAEELSKLTQAQRDSFISAVAQGKGQEEYAKILGEMQNSVKASETSLSLQKFSESESFFGGADKKLVSGLDQSLISDLTSGLNADAIKKALEKASPAIGNNNVGTENQAIALMKSLAESGSLTVDQKANFQKIIDSFASAAEETDLSAISEAFVKGIQLKPKAFEDVQKAQEAAKKAQEINNARIREEIQIREKANASLLQLQADTDSIYKKFNNGVKNLINAMETSSKLRENVGEFKANYLEQSGANQNIVDKQKEANIIQSSNDQLQIGKYKTQSDTINNFQSGVKEMLAGLSIESGKLNLEEAPSDQANKLKEIQLSIEKSLLPVQGFISQGDYEKAGSETEKILRGLPQEFRDAVGPDAIVRAIGSLKGITEDGNAAQKEIVSNSRKDLGIQAQQLVFQKAMSKLNQAQNYGGTDMKGLITNDPEGAFNKSMLALGKLKSSGYNQAGLQQGKTNAVKGSWKGKERETWGLNGKKPTANMSLGLIDFYKAASEIGGESVLSTESKDFGVLSQAISESIRSKMEKLKLAGGGVVDPAVFTRLESTLQTLGGEDEVAKLKTMKELGYANVSGKKIMDTALGGYTGGAFAGLDPQLKKAFESTSDETASATLLLVAAQQKQTDSLSQGFNLVAASGIETNKLLSIQPQAIAEAIGAVLEKGRAEDKVNEKTKESKKIGENITETKNKIESNSGDIGRAEQEISAALSVLGGVPKGVSNEDFIKKQEADIDKSELEKAKKLVGNYDKSEGLTQTDKFRNLFAGMAEQFLSFDMEAADKYYAMADSTPETLKAEYDKAQALVTKDKAINTFKEKNSTLSEKQKENEGLSKKKQELETKQTNIAPDIEVATQAFAQAAQKATELQSKVLEYDKNPQSELDARRKEALLEKNRRENLGGAYQTDRQKEAVKISSPNYKITSADGATRTIEKDAIFQSGAQDSERGRVSKEEFLERKNKAFQMIDQKNALPSFEQFEDIYAQMGGGKEYARQVFEEKKAAKFGIVSNKTSQQPSPGQKTKNLDDQKPSTDPKVYLEVIKAGLVNNLDPARMAQSLSTGLSAGMSSKDMADALKGVATNEGVDLSKLSDIISSGDIVDRTKKIEAALVDAIKNKKETSSTDDKNKNNKPGASSSVPELITETNRLLSLQPQAIADALAGLISGNASSVKSTETVYKPGADLTKSASSKLGEAPGSQDLPTQVAIKEGIKQSVSSEKPASEEVKKAQKDVDDSITLLGGNAAGLPIEKFITQQESSVDKKELDKAKAIVGGGRQAFGASKGMDEETAKKGGFVLQQRFRKQQEFDKAENLVKKSDEIEKLKTSYSNVKKAGAEPVSKSASKAPLGRSLSHDGRVQAGEAGDNPLFKDKKGFVDKLFSEQKKPWLDLDKSAQKGIDQTASKQQSSKLSFIDWAKREGKISKDFQLTSAMKVGEEALPESVAKAKQEFLSSSGVKTKHGMIASRAEDKDRLSSSIKQMEADESAKKMFADQDAAVESMKPKLTGSRSIPDGKGGLKNVVTPKDSKEALQQAEYETAKKNVAFEKANFFNKKSSIQSAPVAAETSKQGGVDVARAIRPSESDGKLRAAEAVVRLDEQISKLQSQISQSPADNSVKEKLEIAKNSRSSFAKIATGGGAGAAAGLDGAGAKELRDKLKSSLLSQVDFKKPITEEIKKAPDSSRYAEQKMAPKAQEKKQEVVQQSDSQSLTSILGAVNQILQFVSNSDSADGAKNQSSQLGAVGSSSTLASSSNVNVSTPINISVGNGAGTASAENAGNQIAQLVSQAISQIEPQIRKIATDAATLAAGKATGNLPPPTQGMFNK